MKIKYKAIVSRLIIICFLYITACNPGPQPGLGGAMVIEGQILLPDSMTSVAMPLKNAIVKLSSGESTNYITQTTTNENGVFRFSHLQKLSEDETYNISCEYSVTSGSKSIQYAGSIEIPQDSFEDGNIPFLVISLQKTKFGVGLTYNGTITFDDPYSGATKPLENAAIELKSTGSSSDANNYATVTDKNGHFVIRNISSGNYTVHVVGSSGQGKAKLEFDNYFSRSINSILTETINLTYKQTLGGYDVPLIVYDSLNTPVPRLPFLVYSSAFLYSRDTLGNQAFIRDTTNILGRALLRGLTKGGTYYVKLISPLPESKVYSPDSVFTATSNLVKVTLRTR
jgi:hypothetical protein